MQLPQEIELKGIRVLTSKQIAEEYGTTTDIIKKNFSNNRSKFTEGKHYIILTGDELKTFKNQVKKIHLVANRASHLYLWTEKGALLHAKSLNTDKAWEVYDYLVDFYFRASKENAEGKKPATKEGMGTVVDVPENIEILNAIRKIEEDMICMKVLLDNCKKYTDEETYIENRRRAVGVIHIMIEDCTKLLRLEPGLIQKH